MTSKTLLETIKSTTGELGFVQPAVVTSSLELTAIQLRYLTIAACDELLEAHNWQDLIYTHSITTNGGGTYTLPTDFQRMVNMTAWNVTTSTELSGASNSAHCNEYVENNDVTQFRIIGSQFKLAHDISGQTITFSYISNKYVLDGGTHLPKAEFSLDSDTTIFHARLLINFLKLKFLQVKGLNTASAVEDYNAILRSAIGNDSPSPSVTTRAPASDASFEVEY